MSFHLILEDMENLYLALKLRGRGIHMEDGCRRQFISSTSQFHTLQVFSEMTSVEVLGGYNQFQQYISLYVG